MAMRIPSLLTAVRCEAVNPPESNGTPNSKGLQTRHRSIYVSKPTWVVRTESNVWKEKTKKPLPPCAVCGGSGRVDCHHCCGKGRLPLGSGPDKKDLKPALRTLGRTNCANLMMLPTGEWPKWCGVCGGSGLGYCSRCIGTGEYRYIMGFQFMKRAGDDIREQEAHQASDDGGQHSTAELFLRGEVDRCEDKYPIPKHFDSPS